jgi:hypothetical protein
VALVRREMWRLVMAPNTPAHEPAFRDLVLTVMNFHHGLLALLERPTKKLGTMSGSPSQPARANHRFGSGSLQDSGNLPVAQMLGNYREIAIAQTDSGT